MNRRSKIVLNRLQNEMNFGPRTEWTLKKKLATIWNVFWLIEPGRKTENLAETWGFRRVKTFARFLRIWLRALAARSRKNRLFAVFRTWKAGYEDMAKD